MLTIIIKKSWAEIWRHKKLWGLGILTSFLGTVEESELVRNISYRNGQQFFVNFLVQLKETRLFTQTGIQGLVRVATHEPLTFMRIIFFLLLVLSVLGVGIWLSIVAQGGIVTAVGKNRDLKNSNLRMLLAPGIKKFWPLAGLNLAGKSLTIALFFIAAIGLRAPWYIAIPVLGGVGLAVIGTFSLIKLSLCERMLHSDRLIPALNRGWQMTRWAWRQCLGLAVTLMIITILILTTGFFLVLVVFIPFFFILAAAFLLKFVFGLIFILLLFSLMAFVFVAGLFGFLSALSWSAWTRLYQELSAHPKI